MSRLLTRTLPVPAGFLVFRYAHTIGNGSAYDQVHDFLAAELDRLVQVDAGALVLNGVANFLIAVKARLFRTDGLLPLAELISSNVHQFPGIARWAFRSMGGGAKNPARSWSLWCYPLQRLSFSGLPPTLQTEA